MRIRKRSMNSFSFYNSKVPISSSSHCDIQTIMAGNLLLQLNKRSSSHDVQAEKKLGADDHDQVRCHRRGEDHHHHHHQLEVHDHDTRGRISRSIVDLMSSDLPAPENREFRPEKGGGIENSGCRTFGGRRINNYGDQAKEEKSMTKKTERSSDHDQGSCRNQLGSLREKLIVPSSTTTTSRSDANKQSHDEDGRWNEGERAFPLKKRRNPNWQVSNISSIDHHDHDVVVHEHDAADAEANNGFNESYGERINKLINKKGKKLGKVMSIGSGDDSSKKGWKCSRMNGRGWRCNKPTLVGYSLCEHHLGKGRRMKTIAVNLTPKNATSSDDYHVHQQHNANKKLIKTSSTSLNGVKCRSINNILHTRYQDNN